MGIPTDAPLLLEMVADQTDIVEEHYLTAREPLLFPHLVAVDDVTHVVDECLHQRADEFPTEVVLRLQDLCYDGVDITGQHIRLSFRQRKDRMEPGKEEKRIEVADASDDIVEEVIRDHNRYAVTIIRGKEVLYQLAFPDDDDIALLDT